MKRKQITHKKRQWNTRSGVWRHLTARKFLPELEPIEHYQLSLLKWDDLPDRLKTNLLYNRSK